LVWSAQCLLVPPVLAFVVLRELRRPLSWLARRVGPAAVATAAMAAAVLALQNAVPMTPSARLLASASVGAAVYVAVAWLALGRHLPRALLTASAGGPAPQRPGGRAASTAPPRLPPGPPSPERFTEAG
jgi:hypothetical protein